MLEVLEFASSSFENFSVTFLLALAVGIPAAWAIGNFRVVEVDCSRVRQDDNSINDSRSFMNTALGSKEDLPDVSA